MSFLLYIIGFVLTAIVATFVFALNTKDSRMPPDDLWFAAFLMLVLAALWPVSVPVIGVLWSVTALYRLFRAYVNGETKMPTISVKIND